MEGEGKILKYVTKTNFEDNAIVSPWSPLSFFVPFTISADTFVQSPALHADCDWQNVVFIKEKTSLAGTLHSKKSTKQAFAAYSNLSNEKNKEKMSKKHRQFLIAFQNT